MPLSHHKMDINSDKFTKIKIAEAMRPKQGLCKVYVDYWWAVTPHNEILVYGKDSAQCHPNENVMKTLLRSYHPPCTVQQLAMVMFPIDPNDYV